MSRIWLSVLALAVWIGGVWLVAYFAHWQVAVGILLMIFATNIDRQLGK